jgi:DNA invertase Pin-like site-specific DNA recombinase
MKTYLIARCSSKTQKLDSQVKELQKRYPEGEVIKGFRSGVSKKNRAALKEYIDMSEEGDRLVFLRLSRVARSLPQFLWFFKAAHKKGVNIELLKDNIEFETPGGRLCASMLFAMQSWAREIQLENCREGRKAKASKPDFKGWGRDSKLSPERVKRIRTARHNPDGSINRTLKSIADEEGLSVSYIHRLTEPEKRKRYNEAHKARQRAMYAEAD